MTVCGIKHADGVCVMGECPHIKKCCPVVWDKRKSDPQTNEEWFCGLSTEEKAEFLYDIAYFDNWSDAIMNDSLINETAVEDAIEKWLKQPHTPKE